MSLLSHTAHWNVRISLPLKMPGVTGACGSLPLPSFYWRSVAFETLWHIKIISQTTIKLVVSKCFVILSVFSYESAPQFPCLWNKENTKEYRRIQRIQKAQGLRVTWSDMGKCHHAHPLVATTVISVLRWCLFPLWQERRKLHISLSYVFLMPVNHRKGLHIIKWEEITLSAAQQRAVITKRANSCYPSAPKLQIKLLPRDYTSPAQLYLGGSIAFCLPACLPGSMLLGLRTPSSSRHLGKIYSSPIAWTATSPGN